MLIFLLQKILDKYANIFTAYLLILYCTFSSLILSTMAMVSFYILSLRFFLQSKGLSDATVVSITKTEYDFIASILERFTVFRVSI